VPVVDKEIYFKKNNKNPELAGRLKETVKQVSHSKKWPRFKGEDGHWVNSYSLLQDRFFEHMKAAGFDGFERGERGSTAKHLSVMEYKTQKEADRAAALSVEVEQKKDAAAVLDKQAAQKKKQLDSLERKTAVAKKDSDVFADIDGMADRRTTFGNNVIVAQSDWNAVSALAKEGQKSRSTIKDLRKKTESQSREIAEKNAQLKRYGKGLGISDSMEFYMAQQRAPRRMKETIDDIKRQLPEQQPQNRAVTRDKRHKHSR